MESNYSVLFGGLVIRNDCRRSLLGNQLLSWSGQKVSIGVNEIRRGLQEAAMGASGEDAKKILCRDPKNGSDNVFRKIMNVFEIPSMLSAITSPNIAVVCGPPWRHCAT